MDKLIKITDAKNVSGIYCIKNDANGKLYVGSTVNIYRRLNLHRSTLRAGTHHNIHLQRAWNKCNESNFSFWILETVKTNIIEREQWWLDRTKACGEGYNLTPTANSNKGYKHTPEAIEKIRKSQAGRPKSESNKQHMKESRHHLSGWGKSQYKGLSFNNKKKRWEVRIKPAISRIPIYLGMFKSEEEAAKNYDFYALQFYGDECFLNFPQFDYTNFKPRRVFDISAYTKG